MGTESPSARSTEFTPALFDATYPEGVERHYWSAARNHIVERLLRRYVLASRDTPALEIGCARGVVVDHLRRAGLAVWGCDLGRPKPIRPEVEPFLRLECDAFALHEPVLLQAQAILLLDILEHLADPRDFLTRLAAKFPRASTFLITLPARTELWSNYDEHQQHYLRYDHRTIGGLAPAGFRMARWGYFFHSLYYAGRALMMIRKKRTIIIRAPGRLARPLHWVLSWGFVAEYLLLPRSLPGSSIYLVLKADEGE